MRNKKEFDRIRLDQKRLFMHVICTPSNFITSAKWSRSQCVHTNSQFNLLYNGIHNSVQWIWNHMNMRNNIIWQHYLRLTFFCSPHIKYLFIINNNIWSDHKIDFFFIFHFQFIFIFIFLFQSNVVVFFYIYSLNCAISRANSWTRNQFKGILFYK